MGLFDRIFGPKPRTFSTPDQLRDALLEAAISGNPKALPKLLETHRAEIDRHCEEWVKPPESIRQDPAAIDRYVNGLIAVAIALGNGGRPRLLEKLTGGGPEGNPFKKWEEAFNGARVRMSEGDFDGARTMLENGLLDTRNLMGSGVERYRSISFGMISQCRFHVGQMDPALTAARNALEICEKIGDVEGIHAYLQTLLEVRRYQGDAGGSAALLDRLAELSGRMKRPEEARRWARLAVIVRGGEPLCRIVVRIEDRVYEEDEAPSAPDRKIVFEFRRNRLSLGRSDRLVEAGKDAGSKGDSERALAFFREAAAADPYDPDSHYQAGTALMILGLPDEAVEELEATEERAPGWFQCRSDLWLARQIEQGLLPPAIHELLRALQDSPATSKQKLELVGPALSKFPELAPLHHQQGLALRDSGQDARALDALRKGLSFAAEPDLRTRLMVDLAAGLDAGEERASLLKDAAALRGNLVAAATARYLLRCGG